MTIYSLIFMLSGAVLLGFLHIIPQNPFAITFSVAFLLFVGDIIDRIFAHTFGEIHKRESVFITALILGLIISPPLALNDSNYYTLAFWAATLAVSSKYILAIKGKHIFNPAAVAVVITSFSLGLSATWWIGTPALLPFVAIGGLLLVRKIRRGNLVMSFFVSTAIFILVPAVIGGGNVLIVFWDGITRSAVLFFATIMLTEPLTTPPSKILRIMYGALVGLLFAPWVHFGSVYGTPELALLVANFFFFFTGPRGKFWIKPKTAPPAIPVSSPMSLPSVGNPIVPPSVA